MKKYNLVAENLTEGQKVTIVSSGEFGGMYALQTVYGHADKASHYYNCPESMVGVKIFHTPKRKRRMFASTISYNVPLVIYDGWVDIDTDAIMFNKKPLTDEQKASGILEISESKYTMFDNRMFSDLLAAYPNPMLCDVK